MVPYSATKVRYEMLRLPGLLVCSGWPVGAGWAVRRPEVAGARPEVAGERPEVAGERPEGTGERAGGAARGRLFTSP
jgi:hypothetical protein